MDLTELRIGNYVWDDYSGEMIVTGINILGDIELRKKMHLPSGSYQFCDPIPLTQEWLKRFGFTFSEPNPYGLDYWEIKDKEMNATFCDGVFVVSDYEYNPSCKYVHELQNLYYVYFKKELKLTDNP